MISGIKKKAVQAQLGMTYSTKPKGIVVGENRYVVARGFDMITSAETQPNGEGIKPLVALTGASLKGKSPEELLTLVQPPDPRVNFALSDSEATTLTGLNEAVNKQLIQQFYEAYHSPTGLMDSTYRLGTVQASIDDIHQLYPNGMTGLLSSDANAAWRTNINFIFSVDEHMKDANGNPIAPYLFKSYSFPPFISKSETDFNAYKLDGTPTITSEVAYTLDRSFDLNNLLYKGNKATIRTPAFKSINDNINTIQFMYNRAFGIESTYINEWDLTMYMQEGIVQYLEQPNVYNPNENIYLPQFVTTLTYGLVNDAPIEENARSTSGTKTLDINDVTPFASWNMAVSTRKSVDNTMVAQACNTMSYEISHYPLSTYWYPSLMGQNLDYQTYFTYVKQNVYDEYGMLKMKNGEPETIDVPVTHYTDMNVASYIDQLFAYRQSGKVWAPNAEADAGGMKKYSPSHIHGNDLRNSTCAFEYVIAHADARDAVLSGWNSTDVEGTPYVPGNSKVNDYVGSNAYSYLPFWKQFFFSPSDGMEDLDQYWQEIQGSTEPRKSILEAAQEILKITCADNEPFNSFCTDKEEEYGKRHPNDSNALANSFTMADESSSDYGDIQVSLPIVGKVTIPKTKLLNMFLHRKEQENKANAAKDRQQAQFVNNTFANIANIGKKSVGGANSGAQEAIDQANSKGNEQSTIVYDIQNEEDLGSTISYGEGVNNHSPFLYGGPHGAFYSPQTLEGYCQQENEIMETVPTMDAVERYNYRHSNGYARRKHVLGSKNFKLGKYADSKVCVGLSERGSAYNLMVKNADPSIRMFYSGGWSSDHIRRDSACRDWSLCWRWFWHKKHCIHFCIPTRFIFLESRWSWGWPILQLFGKWENKYWRNYSAGHTVYTWRTIKLSEIQRDFSNQFTLVPQEYRTRMNSNWRGNWDVAKNNDTKLYRDHPGKWEPIDGDNNYCLDLGESWQLGPRQWWGYYKNHPTLRYIVAETSGDYVVVENTDSGIKGYYSQSPKDPVSEYVFGKRVNTYDRPGSVFETVKQNLYTYANGWGGTSDYFTITLPICNKGNRDDIVNLCCGVANIEKQRVKAVEYRITYEWRYGWFYSWYTHHHGWWGHSWWNNRFGARKQVICNRWFSWCHPRWWHRFDYRYKYYYREPVEVERDTYTMYFYPDLMKYSIPTNGYLPTTNNDLSRNKSTSSIIDRWSVNTNEDGLHGPKPLTSLIDWFPFSSQYQKKFGTGDLEEPGTHYGFKSKVGPCLRTRGLLIGDIMQIYHNHGKRVFVRGGDGYMWLWSTARVGYQRYVHEFDTGCYLYITNTSTNYRSWTIPLRSQYQIAANTGGFADPVLTAAVDGICKAPAVLQYYLNDDTHNGAPLEKNRRFQFYNVSDVFDVYIDTVTVQLAWVKQMLEFSKAYLNDYTIWKTYSLVTDNKIKNIIAEAAGTYMGPDNWMTDIYKTGNATEDINYYDALMIVKLAFGYQQNNPDTNKNTIATLIERRISDLNLLREAAINFKNIGVTWDNLNNFAKFVSDTKAVLDNVNGARERMFVNNRVVTMPGIYDSIFFNQRGHITYNLVENPSTLIWAYLNVLYQARKFYVNKRLDKVQGSYWIMRSLERVMTFQAAQAQNENRKDLLDTPSYESSKNQNKQIAFSMSRDDPTTESQKTEIDLTPSYTKAIWVPVDYVKHPDPTSTPDYVKGVFDGKEKVTYRGREIVYVPEVYKWAYKPADGLYYVMSQDISNNIRNYVAAYTKLVSQVESGLDDITLETISQADSLGPITKEDLDKVAKKGTENGAPVYYDWKGNKRVYNWFVGKNLLEIPDVILYSRYHKKTFGTIESSTVYAQASDIIIKVFNIDDPTLDYSKGIVVVVSDLDPNRIISVTDKGILKEGAFSFDEEKNLILVTKTDQTLEDYLGELLASSTYKYDPSVQELSDLSKHRYDNWQLEVANLIYKNRIIQAYHNSLFGKANELMYPIYIEWTPSATGSAMTESDLKKPECHYIDDYQLMESSTRVSQYEIMEREGLDPSWEWPTVTDGKNLDHKVGILRSGITFGVAAGVNIDTIVSNIQLLGNSTTQEIACAATDKKDYWRIEIPDAKEPQNEGLGHNIPIALLEHKPVLVSNYMFQMFEKEMKGIVNPTVETTLVGLSSNALSPVKDFDTNMVTTATLAAVGELPSLQSLGVPGLTANEAELHFG